MDTRAIALTIVFAAVAIALTPVAVPAGFLIGYYFRFWEIPIVVAFLLLGPRIGVTVAAVRALAELTIFPGPTGFLGPITSFGGTLAMLLGIYVAGLLLKRKQYPVEGKRFTVAAITLLSTFGAFSRASIVPFIMYPVYRWFASRAFTDAQIMVLVPGIMVFAAVLALYTIAAGYLIARTISRSLGVGNRI